MKTYRRAAARAVSFATALSMAGLSSLAPAHSAWTVYLTSPAHTSVKTNISINYDVQQVHFGITDSDPTRYYFYLNFVKPVTASMFADGLNSYAGINLDINGDDKFDYSIRTDPKQPYAGNYVHTGKFFDLAAGLAKESTLCAVQTFTDLTQGVDWVGFSIPNDCLPFKKSLGIQGTSSHDPNGKNEFDFVPDNPWFAPLDGNTGSDTSGTGSSSSDALTSELPSLPQTPTVIVTSPANPPADLVNLAANETKSVVTINCGTGLGSGWSAKVVLTAKQQSTGYRSYLVTNYHVIADCTTDRAVTITLANQATISGYLLAWDAANDVAGILTRTYIAPLIMTGEHPEEGWWTGVIGSPLGFPGVLTEGIISSIAADNYLATTTAHINPGNSGGPAFDRTGRVIGLATAKYVDSEGFGIIHGAPMLCEKVISCSNVSEIWSSSNTNLPDLTGSGNPQTADASAQNSQLRTAAMQILASAKTSLTKSNDLINKAIISYPSAKSDLLSFQALAPSTPSLTGIVVTDINIITEFSSETTSFGKLVNAKIASLALIVKPKLITISCVKAKVIKKVTAVTPKCPTGYVLKK